MKGKTLFHTTVFWLRNLLQYCLLYEMNRRLEMKDNMWISHHIPLTQNCNWKNKSFFLNESIPNNTANHCFIQFKDASTGYTAAIKATHPTQLISGSNICISILELNPPKTAFPLKSSQAFYRCNTGEETQAKSLNNQNQVQ